MSAHPGGSLHHHVMVVSDGDVRKNERIFLTRHILRLAVRIKPGRAVSLGPMVPTYYIRSTDKHASKPITPTPSPAADGPPPTRRFRVSVSPSGPARRA